MNCKIIDIATKLFISNGAKTVTMDDVSTHCGISKKTLYQKYSNKEQLLEEVMCNISQIIQEKIEEIVALELNPIEELLMIQYQILKFFNSDNHAFSFQLNKYYPEIYNRLKAKKLENFRTLLNQNFQRGEALQLYEFPIEKSILIHIFFTADKAIKNGEFMHISSDVNYLFRQNFKLLILTIATPKGLAYFKTIMNQYEIH